MRGAPSETRRRSSLNEPTTLSGHGLVPTEFPQVCMGIYRGNVMRCLRCGSYRTNAAPGPWSELIGDWRLASHEAAYINRQQGYHCTACSSNLRCMVLARAIMACFEYPGLFQDFVRSEAASCLRLLEINEAAAL